jgi:hypothetical protein
VFVDFGLGLLKRPHVMSIGIFLALAVSGIFSATTDSVAHDIRMMSQNISRPPGEMASRLTTNQEIAGSTPAVVIVFFNFSIFLFRLLSSRVERALAGPYALSRWKGLSPCFCSFLFPLKICA